MEEINGGKQADDDDRVLEEEEEEKEEGEYEDRGAEAGSSNLILTRETSTKSNNPFTRRRKHKTNVSTKT